MPSAKNASLQNEANIAGGSVYRLLCLEGNDQGTGFLHKSGNVLTAAHVVQACEKNNVTIIDAEGKNFTAHVTAIDPFLDIAIVTPDTHLAGEAFQIFNQKKLYLGNQVATWGFPGGYSGLFPLLTLGYLSGIDKVLLGDGKTQIKRYVVNAAFNSGNSGGPLIDIESNQVIGIVTAKLAPFSARSLSEMRALITNPNGMQYRYILPDGRETSVSEGQVVADVLQAIRSQVQLVIGYSTITSDLIDFLQRNKIDP